MSTAEIEYLGHPKGMDDSAEYPHPPPDPEPALWGEENTLGDWEGQVDLIVEETGEIGVGSIEYSVLPARPRWVSR